VSSVDRALERVQERLARERAEGRAPRPAAPEVSSTPVRRTPKPADQLTRERKQELWDFLLANEPELAQLIRGCRQTFGTIEVEAIAVEGRPNLSYGQLRPFNAIRIEVVLPDKKSVPKSKPKGAA
jgi:hypothetical protein